MANIEIEDEEKEQEAQPSAAKTGLPATIEAEESKKFKDAIAGLEKQLLYLRADFDTFRRNANKERGLLFGQGQDSILIELFRILDLFERAIKLSQQADVSQPVIDGLKLVQKEINLIFEKYGVERIPTEGAEFNPKIHEAIGVEDVPNKEPGTIVSEYEPGFIREGRVLKPARVVVAKERQEP